MENDDLENLAKEFVKKNEDFIIAKFAGESSYIPDSTPISLFMAGSPGAGKTEVSRSLVKKFNSMPILIDADELRKICPGYIGTNAHIFQKAAVKGINILLDHALDNKLNFILDGTFAYADPIANIQRSIDRSRVVEVWFIYQKPELAWKFTQIREAVESRRVVKEKFIEATIKSRDNAISAKKHFGKAIELNLLTKNLDNTDGDIRLNISTKELDRYLGTGYTKDELNNLLE
ncbi:MAG: zeta toxin family protein [Patescibacteria group bacterium]